jgi:FHS family glucose/mannose:H+ symporter-like MFS transporter
MQNNSLALSAQTHNHRLSIIIHAGFVLVGIVNTLLGPILPALSSKWSMNDAHAGYLFAAMAIGAMLGAAVSGWLIGKLGVIRLLVTGFTLMAASLVCLSLSNWTIGLFAIFCCGGSLGLTNPTINLLVAEIHKERRAAAINLVNLAWGVGAATGPLLIAGLGGDNKTSLPLWLLAALLLVIAVLIALCQSVSVSTPVSREGQAKKLASWRDWSKTYVLLTGALIFCYVGTETATGGWLASYAKRLNTNSNSYWAITQSIFWAGLLLGRALAPLALNRLTERRLLLLCAFISLLGAGFILSSDTSTYIFIGASLTGVGMSAIFPTTIALFTEYCGASANRMTGILFLLGSLGGAIIPWLVGQASNLYANLRIGMAVIFSGAVLVFVLQIAITKILARQNQKNDSVAPESSDM